MRIHRSTNQDAMLQRVIQSVYTAHSDPEDAWEVSALLESMGWTDERIRIDLGFDDIFHAATFIWGRNHHRVNISANDFLPGKSLFQVVREGVRHFLRGVIFALPMAISIASMIYLHLSLWAYQYLSIPYATSIAIGTILSFVSVGGFMQSIARQGYFYIFQGYYNMAQRMTMRFILYGLIVSVVVSGLLFTIDLFFPILPLKLVGLAIAYYIVLNAIWLSVTAMYILKKELIFTGLVMLGILIVYFQTSSLHLNILFSQIVSMSLVAVMATLIIWYLFKKISANHRLEMRIKLPRAGILIYSISPYFYYGALYFMLLFADRVMAWSTHVSFSNYFIWFRGNYEVGLDLALISLVIPTGVSEVIVNRLMDEASLVQMKYFAWQTEEMGRNFIRLYRRGMFVMAFLILLSALLDILLVNTFLNNPSTFLRGIIRLDSIGNFVFIFGIISYGFLACALLNSMVMFSLSRPEYVLRPILVSILLNMVIGFLFSRWLGYQYAVLGLFVSSLVFLIWTTRNTVRVLLRLDYHLYLLA